MAAVCVCLGVVVVVHDISGTTVVGKIFSGSLEMSTSLRRGFTNWSEVGEHLITAASLLCVHRTCS